MAIQFNKARDFVYSSGVLFERALFGYLFEDRPIEHVRKAVLAYKNPDNGFGNALEHDVRTPDSHPAALEYLLSVLVRDFNIGAQLKDVFDGTVGWLEKHRAEDGSLMNPASLREYPAAPWWVEWGGQKAPDSIVGNLTALGLCSPSLAESTRRWVSANLTLDQIRANEWLFMAYHSFDYFMHVNDFSQVENYREAVLDNIAACARKMPEAQYYQLIHFAPTPDSRVNQRMPDLVARSLDFLASAQRDDGHWDDEHSLPQWYPLVTILTLYVLKHYGKDR